MSPHGAGSRWVTNANGEHHLPLRLNLACYLLPCPCLQGTGNLASSQAPAVITTFLEPCLLRQDSTGPISSRAASHPATEHGAGAQTACPAARQSRAGTSVLVLTKHRAETRRLQPIHPKKRARLRPEPPAALCGHLPRAQPRSLQPEAACRDGYRQGRALQMPGLCLLLHAPSSEHPKAAARHPPVTV